MSKYSFIGVGSNSSANVQNATKFIAIGQDGRADNATEANVQLKEQAGTISYLTYYVVSFSFSSNSTFRSRIAGANGNLTTTSGVGGLGRFSDISHSDSVANGDLVDFSLTGSAAPFLQSVSGGNAIIDHTSSYINSFSSTANTIAFAGTTATYYQICGAPAVAGSTTVTDESVKTKVAGTWDTLQVQITANAKAGNTTVGTYINTTTGNTTVTIGSTATGAFSDLSHSDAVVSNDLLAMVWNSAASGTISGFYKTRFTATGNVQDLFGTYNAIAGTNGATSARYHQIMGQMVADAVALNSQQKIGFATTFQYLRAKVVTQAAANNLVTSTYINTTTGNNTVTHGPGVTGYMEDLSHTDSISIGDLVGYVQAGTSNGTTKTSLMAITQGTIFNTETGTGVLSFGGMSLVGVGTDTHTGVGVLSFGGISLVGVATDIRKGTGVLSFGALALVGAGTDSRVSTGVLSFGGMSLAGTGVDTRSGTGILSFGALALAGAGVDPSIGRGILSFSGLSFDAAGEVIIPTGAGVLAFGPLAYVGSAHDSPAKTQITQFGLLIPSTGPADARLTQYGLLAMAGGPPKTRITQMGVLVLATGKPAPIQPDPLTLSDAGRLPVLRQRLVNMYVEPTPQGPGKNARYGRPGLYNVAARGDGPIRASFLWKGFRITVSGNQVWRDGVNIGTIAVATGPCRFAFSDEELVLSSGGLGYYVTETSVAPLTDPDLVAMYIWDIVFLASRFVYMDKNSSQFAWSELGDARNVDGLSFATAAEGSAEKIVGAAILVDTIAFFMERTIEWWYAVSDPDNPFQRSSGRKNDRGCAAILSIVPLDNSLFFVGNDKMVYRSSTVPQRISDFSIEDEIRRVSQADLPNCTAFGVVFGGHTFYVLSLPGRGSWAYDVSSDSWAVWKSHGKPLFRVSTCDQAGVCGDMYSGNLMGFNGELYIDLETDPIERVVASYLPLKTGSAKNQNLALDCYRGAGLPTGYGSDPMVEMRFSDQEGRRFSPWIPAPLGFMGDASDASKAIWTGLGAIRSPGRLYEFRCTAPVFFAPWQVRYNEDRL